MFVPNDSIPSWYMCEECGAKARTDEGFPERWMLMWWEDNWIVLCPCAYTKSVENTPEEVDGSGYARGGLAWNPSATTTTTWNPGMFTVDMYTYPPLKKDKPNYQERLDAVLAEMEEEKAEQLNRWKKWEETKHSKHMDPTCERCVEEIERIKRELKEFGKGNGDEK